MTTYLCPANTDLEVREGEKCTWKLKRILLACFLLAALPEAHCLALGREAEQAVSAAGIFLLFVLCNKSLPFRRCTVNHLV